MMIHFILIELCPSGTLPAGRCRVACLRRTRHAGMGGAAEMQKEVEKYLGLK